MQLFKNTANGEIFAFEDDIEVTVLDGVYGFAAPSGTRLNTPPALVPYTPPSPSPAELLAKEQAIRLADLRAACAAEITGGYLSSALGAPHRYPSGDIDQANMTASVLASLMPGLKPDWATPFWCADAGGTWSFAPHSAAQIQQAGSDGKAFVVAAQQRLADLTAQLATTTTLEAVQAITW